MRVGFTGTQHGMTESQKIRFKETLSSLGLFDEFHHGDCVGADAEAHVIAQELGFDIHIHPSTHPNRAYCRGASIIHKPKAPLDRNRDIVDVTDVLVASPRMHEEELRSGTWATVRYARRIKRSVIMVYP